MIGGLIYSYSKMKAWFSVISQALRGDSMRTMCTWQWWCSKAGRWPYGNVVRVWFLGSSCYEKVPLEKAMQQGMSLNYCMSFSRGQVSSFWLLEAAFLISNANACYHHSVSFCSRRMRRKSWVGKQNSVFFYFFPPSSELTVDAEVEGRTDNCCL